MTYRMIQVGTGGFGRAWCESFLPPSIEQGLVEVVAAVDINPAALAHAQRFLGLPGERCYTDIDTAFEENAADFCTIVVPPAYHETVVDVALRHDMHILSEKPIADSLPASVRVASKVRSAGIKMGLTLSHRFRQDITSLREEVRSGRCGQLDYLVCRLLLDNRVYGSAGGHRHDIPDSTMVDCGVHHLDILADLAGARCETIYAETWNPPWGEFAGHSEALVTMRFANGVRGTYEGSRTNAAGLNHWGQEYIRAECERATLSLTHRRLERFDYDAHKRQAQAEEGHGEWIPLRERPSWGHIWLIEQFVQWLDGGEPMETSVEANLESVAIVFAGIESSRTGKVIRVEDYLSEASRMADAV